MHSFDKENNELEFVKVTFISTIYLHHLIIKVGNGMNDGPNKFFNQNSEIQLYFST